MTTVIYLPPKFLGRGMPGLNVARAASGDVEILPRGILGRRFPEIELEAAGPYVIEETTGVSESLTELVIWVLGETLTLDESISAARVLSSLSCDESLSTQDRITYGHALLLAESFTTAENLSEYLVRLLTVAEATSLTDTLSTWQQHALAIAESLLISEAVTISKHLELADAVTVTETLLDSLTLILEAAEELSTSEAVTNVLTLVLSADEDLTQADAVTDNMVFQLLCAESMAFVSRILLDGEEYTAWVVNADTGGAWEYDNYNFPGGLTRVGNKFLGLKSTGLYELTGDDDDGTEIAARMRTGLTDFGTSRIKNVPRAYVGYNSETGMVLKTITTDGGKKKERWYKLKARPLEAPFEARVKLGRGVRARYWGFEIHNVDGGNISFDKIQLLPVVLKRRV